MPFCSTCGKQHSKGDSFCAECGNVLKEVKDVIERTVEIPIKKSHKGFVFLIIFLVLAGYIVLDVWAISQLTPIISLDSLASSVANFNADVGYTTTTLSSTVTIENPTFVPVIAGRVIYDGGYGNTKIIDGKTGWIILSPYSSKDLPADVKVSYAGGIVSGIKLLKNLFTGQKETWNANFYADLGITKFKLKEYQI